MSVNSAACALAVQAASEASESVLVGGGVTKTTQYTHGASKEDVQTEFQRQLDFYIRNEFDFVVAEVIVGCGRWRNHCWLACSLMPFGGISLKLSGVCVVAHPLQIDDIMILGSLYCNCKVLASGIVW